MFESIVIDCSGRSPEEIEEAALASVAEHRLAYLRNFPIDVDQYTALLSRLGELCPNYAAGSTKDAYTLHEAINVVRCRAPRSEGPERVQEKAGALPMHSGRSFARRRPLFLAMLMTDPGWQDLAPGSNGESLIVRWGDVLAELRTRYPEQWAEDLRLLTSLAMSFPASHLDEEPSLLPFLYVPGTPRRTPVADDVAARLPQDVNRLRKAAESLHDGRRWFEAITRFQHTANDPAITTTYVMRAGDLVVLDNDRYGHGRQHVVAARTGADGTQAVNPRAIWSVNIQ
ncbi:TauD/TfdA family dioxygenase [Streptomyces sp. CSDS2]|uniref:TauD/TfdA family dioxygenase n=1 Tax=Streptomyces sp. CSDS2 TaxID=3055051 RepID=UPI0025B1CE26|nr:TauD/TfdA family dioxygenase [Streptomyces sp. CSDS2]MDN3260528.1 TauD/TfdA family dioxygenase [Streptomyces sp. CSDS2]